MNSASDEGELDELVYYFSTGSRYSYLSMSQMLGIETRSATRVRWVPVNGKRIRALRGADPFAGPPQSGQYDWTYREKDAKAWARYYGIDFAEPVDVEFDVECLLRGVIAASWQVDVRAYAWSLAQEVFARRTWPLDQSVVERVAEEQGLDMHRFTSDCVDPLVQKELEDNCVQAVSRGAFGTPSMFVGEELYWGNDRLVLFEHALRQRSQQDHPFSVQALDHVVLRSAEPQALVDFYTQLLNANCERVVDDFLWQLRIGDSLLDVLRAPNGGSEAAAAQTSGVRAGVESHHPSGVLPNMDHFCVRVTGYNEQRIAALATSLGGTVRASGNGSGNANGNGNGNIYGARGYGASTYVTDPQGNVVEIKAG